MLQPPLQFVQLFLSATDGKTPVTSLTIALADVKPDLVFLQIQKQLMLGI
jgi:hypothetical protein